MRSDDAKRNVLVLGATGMIGGLVLRFALEDPSVATVTSVGRRSSGIKHNRLREVLHDDFTDYTAISDSFTNQQVALFCLGAYTGTLPDSEFRRVTVDYTTAFARMLHARSPGAVFCFLSGEGADQSEQSRLAFARYKGIAEKKLLKLGFGRTHIFRPGYIYPVTPRKEPNFAYRMFRAAYPLLRLVYPNVGIRSDDLARVMLRVGLHGVPGNEAILDNRRIRQLAAAEPGSAAGREALDRVV